MREKESNRDEEREEECKARSLDSWRKAEFADGSSSFFLRGLGIVTRESKVLWFLRSSLSPSSLEWSFGNEQKQKGLQQTEQRRSFGRPKKENQMSFKGFLRQRSLGLHTTSWDDNEWALRGEERSDWASFGPVANVWGGCYAG